MANSNPGNFANDREKASEAGKKGGQNSGATSPMTARRLPRPDAKAVNTAMAAVATRPRRKPGEARCGPPSFLLPDIRIVNGALRIGASLSLSA